MFQKKNSENRQRPASPLLKSIPFVLYCLSITVAFRFEMYFQNIAVNTGYYNPLKYLMECFVYDTPVLLFFSAILAISSWYIKNLWYYILTAALIFIYQNILVFFSGYYLIFETPFTAASIGEGLTTFWYEMLISSIAELRSRSYLMFFTGIILFVILLYSSRSRFTKLAYSVALLPMIILMPLFIHAAVKSSDFEVKDLPDYNNMVRNPLIVFSDFKKTETGGNAEKQPAESLKSLSTDSLVDRKMMPGIPVERKRYNIILYFAESTASAYTDLKINGREVTPGWNTLCRNSIRFNRHYVQYPLSVNALFNVLSSAYTPLGKKWIPMSKPDFKVKSVSEVLKQNSYRTALFHSGSLTSFKHIDYLKYRKFDLIMDMSNLPGSKYRSIYDCAVDDRSMLKPSIDFMKSGKDPFFVSYFPYAPHHPYVSSRPDLDIYSKADISNEPNQKLKLWKQYINSLRSSDECITDLISELDKNRLLENTVVFIFADHGEAFYQHRGNYLHSIYLYEENIHVPFIIFSRNLFPGRIDYNGISRHIDIVPTLLDLAGVKAESEYEGISLLRPHQQKLAYSHTDWLREYISVRDGDWKYILRSDNRTEELYNLKDDPMEKNNIAETAKDVTLIFREYAKKGRDHQERYFNVYR